MKFSHILLAFGILATTMPLAAATGGPVFCPPHNPGALTNACVVVNVGSTPVTHAYVNGFGSVPVCPISTLCVTVPVPTTGTTTTNVPTADGRGTYVEVTVLCPTKFGSICRVEWPPVWIDITTTKPLLS